MPYVSKLILPFALTLWLVGLMSASAQVLFPVEQAGKWGYVDSAGQFQVKAKYLYAKPFREGLAWVQTDKGWELIDTRGKRINRVQYTDVWPHQAGLARVLKDGLYGLVNREGEEVVPPKYQKIKDFDDNGFAIVQAEN